MFALFVEISLLISLPFLRDVCKLGVVLLRRYKRRLEFNNGNKWKLFDMGNATENENENENENEKMEMKNEKWKWKMKN